jgi:hypothetical protein
MTPALFPTAGRTLIIRSVGLAATALLFARSGAADTAATADTVQSRIEPLDAPNGGNSPATTYQSKFSVSTSTDKSTASLDATGWVSSLGGGNFLTESFTAKAPFDSSKSDVQDLGSLSGLTAGTQAHLALAWSYWSAMPTGAVRDVLGLQKSPYIAQLYGGWPWESPSMPGAPTLVDVLITLKLEPRTDLLITTDDATYKKIIAELNKEIQAFDAKSAKTAGFKPLASVTAVADYSKIAGEAKKDYYGIAQAYSPWVPSAALTLDGNQQSFTYVQASSPTKTTSESKDGTGVSLVASLLHDDWLASLSYAYTESYKAQPSGQVCSPIAGSTSSNCLTAALGAPKETVDHLIIAEFRMRFSGTLAVSPQVQYSTAQSQWGVQIPVYLVADKTKALNGGITFGWTSATHFGAQIFVGKPFSFQ